MGEAMHIKEVCASNTDVLSDHREAAGSLNVNFGSWINIDCN